MKHLRFFHFPHSRVLTRFTVVAVIFLIAFFSGRFLGFLSARSGSASSAAVRSSPVTSLPVSAEGNWGLSFQQEGKPPVANATSDYLKQFNAHYADDTDEKILYLTFDAGYENGNTPAILDALKASCARDVFHRRKLYPDESRSRKTHDCGGTHRRQPHVSPPRHVKNCNKKKFLRGIRILGETF